MDKAWLDYCKSFIPQIKARHKQMLGRECNLENPQRFTDKLEWLKVYDSTFLKTYCSDKLTARKYVAAKLGKDISIPVLGVYDKFDDIDFSKLPKDYVIKTNHGSHTNIIVRNGKVDKANAKKQFDEWMRKDWSWYAYEFHYIPIPRKIFIEPYITTLNNDLPDYKFYCFNGIPKMCQIIQNRSSHETITHYDMSFNIQHIYDQNGYNSPSCNKPATFDEMKMYAIQLSADFKFVRCDFYEISSQVYFGELTFIPGGGYLHYKSDSCDNALGSLLGML